MAANGDYLCSVLNAGRLSLRRADGSEIWSLPWAVTQYSLAFLSPDERRIVRMGVQDSVVSRDGSVVAIAQIDPAGWLDSATVVAEGQDTLHRISVDAPLGPVDMGFGGLFVGAMAG